MNQILFVILSFQDSSSSSSEGITDLHNYVMIFVAFVVLLVLYILCAIVYNFYVKLNNAEDNKGLIYRKLLLSSNKVTHGAVLEILWTLFPVLILLSIVIPSFALLYSLDENLPSDISLKIIGGQWFWSYEYSDFIHLDGLSFDSFMVPETDLKPGQPRLLVTDNDVILPVDTFIRGIVTSNDVLHAWTVPNLGVKVDAVPGRLSQINIFIKRVGEFFGQCSEICGVNHGFMPVTVKAVDATAFHDIYKEEELAPINTGYIPDDHVDYFFNPELPPNYGYKPFEALALCGKYLKAFLDGEITHEQYVKLVENINCLDLMKAQSQIDRYAYPRWRKSVPVNEKKQ